MPTYLCTAAAGLLDAARKQAVAAAITRAHAAVTGAPAHFAQVVFHDTAPGDVFIGGVPLAHEHVSVHGRIRAGRSAEDRAGLIRRLVADIAAAAHVDRFAVWVYLLELPPAAMAEFGHILPEPGAEAAWHEALPEADRMRLEALAAKG